MRRISNAACTPFVDVQQDNIRLRLNNFFDDFFAVLGVPADLKGMPILKLANGYPRRRVVVYNKDSR